MVEVRKQGRCGKQCLKLNGILGREKWLEKT
jgi:hypothetical protein